MDRDPLAHHAALGQAAPAELVEVLRVEVHRPRRVGHERLERDHVPLPVGPEEEVAAVVDVQLDRERAVRVRLEDAPVHVREGRPPGRAPPGRSPRGRAARGDGSLTVTDPATQQPFLVTMDNNVTVSGTDTAFDSLGRPVASGSLLSTARVFTISGSANTASVTLNPLTGFVSVSP